MIKVIDCVRRISTTFKKTKKLTNMPSKIDKSLIDFWQKADAVCLDVDSTVITSEGIDELAAFCGVGDQVAALTAKAMGEGLSFREAFHERLKLIKPSQKKVEEMLKTHPLILTEGVSELVARLHQRNTHVYLISGGMLSFISPLAEKLGIPSDRIFCNKLIYDNYGEYLDFDRTQPTSESQGKPRVIQTLRTKYGYKNMVMIGDGMTDAETSDVLELFIGFGGNCCRSNVRDRSKWFVMSFKELIDLM